MATSLLFGFMYRRFSSHSSPADMVRRWRSVMRSFSGVRKSEYSGKYSNTGSSTLEMSFRSSAMPTSNEVTLFEMDRRSCRTVGPCTTFEAIWPNADRCPSGSARMPTSRGAPREHCEYWSPAAHRAIPPWHRSACRRDRLLQQPRRASRRPSPLALHSVATGPALPRTKPRRWGPIPSHRSAGDWATGAHSKHVHVTLSITVTHQRLVWGHARSI